MEKYTVTLTLSVEACDEDCAVQIFEEKIKNGDYEMPSIEVEKEEIG